MGVSESAQKNCNESLKTFISDVLGSFDCTCKSKCCDNFKCINFYYHCRTINKDDMSETEEETPATTDNNDESPLSINLMN